MSDEFPAQGELPVPVAVGVQAVVTDPDEAPGQDMEHKPTVELFGGDLHDPLPVASGVVPPPELDAVAVEGHYPVVGGGGLVGVPPEVGHDLIRSVEGRLGVDHPVPGSKQ